MDNWIGGSWHWNRRWRRPLFGQENDAAESLFGLPNEVNLVEGRQEKWRWIPESSLHSEFGVFVLARNLDGRFNSGI